VLLDTSMIQRGLEEPPKRPMQVELGAGTAVGAAEFLDVSGNNGQASVGGGPYILYMRARCLSEPWPNITSTSAALFQTITPPGREDVPLAVGFRWGLMTDSTVRR
jgi:hypothetical protein